MEQLIRITFVLFGDEIKNSATVVDGGFII
jgi:hypothetical protein